MLFHRQIITLQTTNSYRHKRIILLHFFINEIKQIGTYLFQLGWTTVPSACQQNTAVELFSRIILAYIWLPPLPQYSCGGVSQKRKTLFVWSNFQIKPPVQISRCYLFLFRTYRNSKFQFLDTNSLTDHKNSEVHIAALKTLYWA